MKIAKFGSCEKNHLYGILKFIVQLFLEARGIKKVVRTRKKIDDNIVRLEPP